MLIYIKPLSTFPGLHSDGLFGALLSAWSDLYPDKVNRIVEDFKSNTPPFILSSTFPAINVNDEKIRFFPKFIINNSSGNSFDLNDLKDFKKVEYYEESIFMDIISGKLSESDILNDYGKYHRSGSLLMNENNDLTIEVKDTILPNNMINRLSGKTKIFYTDGLKYGDNVELFFFIELFDKNYDVLIKSALKFLKDKGFGKDISIGKGQFDYSIEDVSFGDMYKDNINHCGDKFISLSRFIPSEYDLKFINEYSDYSDYEILSKKGKDKSGEPRKQVRFFSEGSTFKNYSEFYGCVVESGINRKAIEYGFAFPINFTLKGD